MTPIQRRLLTAIVHYVRRHGYPPTLRELTVLAAVSSTSVAAHNLRRLQARGYLTIGEKRARTIVLTEHGRREAGIGIAP